MRRNSAVLVALTLAACAPLDAEPAIYVPPEYETTAQAWADAVGLWAPVLPTDPEGPGVVLLPAPYTGWSEYTDQECALREAWTARDSEQATAWAALSGATGGIERAGTALPPPGVRPTLRLDDDQVRAIRRNWADLESACSASGIFSGVL